MVGACQTTRRGRTWGGAATGEPGCQAEGCGRHAAEAAARPATGSRGAKAPGTQAGSSAGHWHPCSGRHPVSFVNPYPFVGPDHALRRPGDPGGAAGLCARPASCRSARNVPFRFITPRLWRHRFPRWPRPAARCNRPVARPGGLPPRVHPSARRCIWRPCLPGALRLHAPRVRGRALRADAADAGANKGQRRTRRGAATERSRFKIARPSAQAPGLRGLSHAYRDRSIMRELSANCQWIERIGAGQSQSPIPQEKRHAGVDPHPPSRPRRRKRCGPRQKPLPAWKQSQRLPWGHNSPTRPEYGFDRDSSNLPKPLKD